MLCRLCLYEHSGENVLTIFNNDEESNLNKLIIKYLHIEITQNDNNSNMICKSCLRHLNEFDEFFQLVEQRQNLLQKEFLELKHDGKDLTSELSEEEFHDIDYNDEPLFDIKAVLLTEMEENPEKFQPQVEFGHANIDIINIKQETDEDVEDNIPLQQLLKKVEKNWTKRKLNQNSKNTKARRVKQLVKNSKSKLASNKSIVSSNSKSMTINTDEVENSRTPKWTAETDKESDELIAKHMPLKCDICDLTIDTFKNLRTHFREEHNTKSYVKCCGMKLKQKFLLLDHIKTHLNPEHFKCELCNKILKTRVSLEHHRSVKHADRDELKHACNVCGKRFPHLSNLNLHMVVHKDEKNHICELCNKGFKTNYVLKAHIQHMHGEKSSYVCDTCGKEYRFKMSFERHVAEHKGDIIDPNLQCPICNKWLSQTYLSRHLKRHKHEECKCEDCGRTFNSKPALASHSERAHKNRQSYPCTICGKIFERSRYLKEHLDMHLGRKDYNCSYCPREFRSKSNMYSHVKKAHFEQWSRAQLERAKGFKRITSQPESNIELQIK